MLFGGYLSLFAPFQLVESKLGDRRTVFLVQRFPNFHTARLFGRWVFVARRVYRFRNHCEGDDHETCQHQPRAFHLIPPPVTRTSRGYDNTLRVVLPTVRTYEQCAETFLARWGRRRYRVPPLLRRFVARIPKQGLVMDLGCGGGQDSRYLRRAGYRPIGLDRTNALLAFARQRSVGLPLIRADMSALPLRAGSFDGVWAAASLIHLPKSATRGVLLQLRDRTKPGAVLAATFTHGKKSGIQNSGWLPGRYFARWTKGELERALCSTGWQVSELKVVTGQERKGRWINVIALHPTGGR